MSFVTSLEIVSGRVAVESGRLSRGLTAGKLEVRNVGSTLSRLKKSIKLSFIRII